MLSSDADTQGDSRSPTRAAFQNKPRKLQVTEGAEKDREAVSDVS